MAEGTIARFADADALVQSVSAVRDAGHRSLEAYAPFPVPGLAEALGFRERWVPIIALVAAVFAAGGTFAMQWYSAVLSYPFVVGGKPLFSWPAFMITTFDMGILATVLGATFGMLALNRLPRPHHPAFDWDAFEHASDDGFFLLVEDGEPAARRDLLERLGAMAIEELSW